MIRRSKVSHKIKLRASASGMPEFIKKMGPWSLLVDLRSLHRRDSRLGGHWSSVSCSSLRSDDWTVYLPRLQRY